MPDKRDQRPKASDVFRDTEFVFAKKTQFEEAFPQIKTLSVQVTESDFGRPGEETSSYGKSNAGEFHDCSNPSCYKGGVSIGEILREMVGKKLTQLEVKKPCQGYEGSPKGHKKYRSCLHSFKVKVSLGYK